MLTIRSIEARDDAAMATIVRTVMPEFGAVGPRYSISDPEVDFLSRAYDDPRSAYFVVEREGQLVGGGGIAPLASGDRDTCELRKMYFLTAARGQGAGTRLLQTCLEAARSRGYRRCYIETLAVMKGAQHLYERAGFRPLCAPLGGTGHACDTFYILDL